MITLARQSRGFTQKELHSRTGIQQPILSKYESGIRVPTVSDLSKIAEVLDYPTDFFLQTWHPDGPGVNEYYHRKRQRASVRDLDRIYATATIQRRNVEALLRSADFPNTNFPSFPVEGTAVEDAANTPEEAARKLRATWHIPRGPIHNITKMIEEWGGVVLRCDFESRHVDGFSKGPLSARPIFYMNREMPPDRWRWTLAHELAHVVIHNEPNGNMERQANAFAGEFLAPAREIKQDLWDTSFENLSRLKIKWKISVQALVMRAHELGVVTDSQKRYRLMQWSKEGYRMREPEHLDPPIEHPRFVPDLIDFHRRELGYSESDLCLTLKINRTDLRERYFSGGGLLQVVE